MKKVSLDQISKELGVSKSLVSFVMNGKAKEMRVSDAMAEKVLDKAKELEYKPNHLARALRTGKSYTIGLVITDISNPFFAKLARSIENEMIKFKYNVIFGSSDESSEKSSKLIELFLDKKVDGLIICPSQNDVEIIRTLQKKKVPYILMDRYFPEIESNVVIVDNKKVAYQIVENQIKKGRKRIAYVNFDLELNTMENRFEGYKEALKAYDIPIDNAIVKNVPYAGIEKKTEQAIKEILKEDDLVDSIFFANNHLALLAIQFIKAYNKGKKQQVNICSFDIYDFMKLIEMPLVYGEQPIKELGEKAVEVIMQQIDMANGVSKKYVLPMNIREIK